MFKQTALTSVDSYKLGHADMYPEGTTKTYSNFTPRSESHFNVPSEYKEGKIVWVGIKNFLQELVEIWDETFFCVPWADVKKEFSTFVLPFVGPNGFNMDRLYELWIRGKLPLVIKALPEGSRVNIGVPVLTITNTLPEFYWLPNFLETWISAELWKMPTSATTSAVYRKIIEKYAKITGGNTDFINWQGHDFSVRGMSGIADAAKSGFGHLLSFTGTDNIPAVKLANDVYRGKETFVGGSVPATEHSVMSAGGEVDELGTFERLINMYPSGVLSIVSDTWDYWQVLTEYSVALKDKILARTPDSFGIAKVVFRPDSGDPVKIIAGYDKIFTEDGDFTGADVGNNVLEVNGQFFELEIVSDRYVAGKELSVAEVQGSVVALSEIFGTTTNALGYRTLNQRVGLIYGDSITTKRAEEILSKLANKGFASDNIVFGIGSFTFQYQTRDTFGFAMKATYNEINGKGLAVFKNPKTDSGTKKSARGLLRVEKEGDDFILYQNQTEEQEAQGELKVVFSNGSILTTTSLADIRNTLKGA